MIPEMRYLLSGLRGFLMTHRAKETTCAGHPRRRPWSLRAITPLTVAALTAIAVGQTSLAQRAKQKQTSRVYSIDAAQSQINVILAQEGFISKRYPTHRVVVKNFNGKIDLPKEETRLSVEVEAEAGSLTNVDEAMSEFERKEFHQVLRNVVLESSKFPTVKFASISVANVQRSGDNRSFTLNGDLTLHGVTKRVSFPVNVTLTKDQIRATGEATLKQSDFGMKPFEKGLGLIKVGDEVKVNFVMVAKT
jgi:polyisoprenoid-binding protein YceI